MTSQERDKLARDNMGLVGEIAKKYLSTNTHLEYDDVFQMGCIGLTRSLNSFNPSKGIKFTTYAYRSISNDIRVGLRTNYGKPTNHQSMDMDATEGSCFLKNILADKSIDNNIIEDTDFFKSLMGSVNEKQRQVLELRYLENMSIVNIQKKLNISRPTIYSRIETGLRTMKYYLKSVDYIN